MTILTTMMTTTMTMMTMCDDDRDEDDDVILTTEQEMLFQNESTSVHSDGELHIGTIVPIRKWPHGVIPYTLSNTMHKKDKMKITAAIDILNSQLSGCIKIRFISYVLCTTKFHKDLSFWLHQQLKM